MAHQRKLIRTAVENKLKAGMTMAGQRVFGNRARQLFDAEIPCILVYTRSEPAETSNEAPREYKRMLTISLELVAQAKMEEDLDDVLDDFCEQVEAIMVSEETFGGLVTDTVLSETEMDIVREGKEPVGAAKISFMMPYYQQMPGDLSGALDDFETASVTVDPDPSDQVAHAKTVDTITEPT